ncbi:MAG: Na+/H+ antiporter subunit E [Micrococcus sp.]|nr:Na+/H+ antiporter subunit E [Micrococcus sp.]
MSENVTNEVPRTTTPGRDLPEGSVVLHEGEATILTWPWRLLVFALWFVWALISSSAAVLRDLLTPGNDARPGIARIASNCRTDWEVTLLSVLITLTPGTLTLGTNRDPDAAGTDQHGAPRRLYVHGLYSDTPAELRADIHDMERRMLHAVRIKGVR